jgi:hypothetical protein
MLAAPDYIEPVIGWRAWAVVKNKHELRLRSVLFDTVWPPGAELTARCNHWWPPRFWRQWQHKRAHAAPEWDCNCGIHAATDLDDAAKYLYLYDDIRQPRLLHRVLGTVSMWGSVIEASHGWRGQFAYPDRLFLPTTDRAGRVVDTEALVDGLALYGVPIEFIDDDVTSRVARAVHRNRSRGSLGGSPQKARR